MKPQQYKKISRLTEDLSKLTGEKYGIHSEPENYFIYNIITKEPIIKAATVNGLELKLYTIYLKFVPETQVLGV